MPSKRLGGIAIVVHNIDSVGGMERQAMHLAERLAARGLRVMIVTSRIEPRFRLLPRLTKPWHEWRGPIEIIRAPAFPNWTSEAVRRLIDVIVTYALLRHRKRIDAIYAVQFTGCEYSAFAAKATGIPAVVKFACGGAPGDFQSIARREDAEQLHAALRCMARYVIISDEIQKEAEEAGLDPALFVRIRNGVDTKRFSPEASPATLPELSWPERKLVLFVGRHDRQKRLDVLLRAFARVRDAIPEARLVSAGPAPSLEEYLSLARELGIEKEVTFLGARTDVAGLYRAASVFVLPSAAEGLPNALLEALASGTPCVATEIPGTTDVVTHEKEALLVPVDDVDALARAIVRLLRDDGLARRLAEAGRARVMAEFDMERVADQYFELFTKLPRIATRARWAQDARTQLRFASALGRKTASFLFTVGLLHARDVTTALVVGVKRFLGIEREILPRRRRAPSKPGTPGRHLDGLCRRPVFPVPSAENQAGIRRMKTLLHFECVSFSFGHRKVIDGANLHIESRTCTALIGPNGGGKTTLLRLAAGLLRPSSGRILFRGAELADLARRDVARRIALVPQHLEIPFSFTVQQIVEQGRTPYIGMWGGLKARDRNAIERAIELTSVGSLRHRIYNELSGGERQRVKIALGLAQEPELLLLDEPTQNLDFGRLMELMALIRMLHREGIDILAAVHDLALIQHTFSSVILINSLEPLLIGSPEDVLRPEILERAFQCPAPTFNFQPDVHPRREFAL